MFSTCRSYAALKSFGNDNGRAGRLFLGLVKTLLCVNEVPSHSSAAFRMLPQLGRRAGSMTRAALMSLMKCFGMLDGNDGSSPRCSERHCSSTSRPDGKPLSSTMRSTPTDHTSHFFVYGFLRRHSGALKNLVPTWPRIVSLDRQNVALPKSMIFSVGMLPGVGDHGSLSMILSGFKSRCATPSECMKDTAPRS